MTRRNYGQYCGLAAALDVLGERWTLLIIRELLLGPRRYGELLAELPGIGTNLLADRLKFLVEHGVLRRSGATGSERGYELTELGEQLKAPILGLARWGLTMLGAPSGEELARPHWGFLAVQAMLDPSRAAGIDEAYEFHVGEADFHISIKDGHPRAVEGKFAGTPAMRATTDAATFLEIGAKQLTPFEALATGRLLLEGDTSATMRCCGLLGLAPGAAPEQAA